MVRQLATLDWLEQLIQVLATAQQLPAAKRHLAAVEWPEQLTRMLVTVQQQLAAAEQHPATVE